MVYGVGHPTGLTDIAVAQVPHGDPTEYFLYGATTRGSHNMFSCGATP